MRHIAKLVTGHLCRRGYLDDDLALVVDSEEDLDENRGVRSVFARRAEIEARVRALGRPGLYVWHDPSRTGS